MATKLTPYPRATPTPCPVITRHSHTRLRAENSARGATCRRHMHARTRRRHIATPVPRRYTAYRPASPPSHTPHTVSQVEYFWPTTGRLLLAVPRRAPTLLAAAVPLWCQSRT